MRLPASKGKDNNILKTSQRHQTNSAMAASIPNVGSGVIGICLVIRAKEGPRFIFNFPPRPSINSSPGENLYGTDLIEEPDEGVEGDDGSDDSELEDDEYGLSYSFNNMGFNASASGRSGHVQQENDEHYDTQSGEHYVPWENMFEFKTTDLESILTPSRAFHKKKFELCLDPYNFVSYPIHIREDGGWKKKKAKKTKKSKKGGDGEEVGDGAVKPVGNGSEDGDDHGGMTMFNVVFILNESKQKIDQKILDIYEHVVKKFNKALHHAQAQSDYVFKESEMILQMKEKAKEDREF